MELRAPSSIKWFDKRATIGKGNARATTAASSLIAIDSARGGRSVVPIKNGVADYGALPKGKLQVRAFPFAEVWIGNEKRGATPFPDVELVQGEYTVTLKYEGKTEKKKIVIKGGATERVNVRFE